MHQAEELFGLKRKAALTTAELAYLLINLEKRRLYWTVHLPMGMAGVDTSGIIDINEAGFKLEYANRSFRKTVSALPCTQT